MIIEFNSLDEFNLLKSQYSKNSFCSWKSSMYSFFKKETWCYYVDEDCFISLEKAKKLGLATQKIKIV